MTNDELLAEIREHLDYDAEKGELRRKRTSAAGKAGHRVGCYTKNRSPQVTLCGTRRQISHLIWLLETGSQPAGDVVYLDGDTLNTRFSNLCLRSDLPKKASHLTYVEKVRMKLRLSRIFTDCLAHGPQTRVAHTKKIECHGCKSAIAKFKEKERSKRKESTPARRAYQAAYRKANKERLADYWTEYRASNRDRFRAVYKSFKARHAGEPYYEARKVLHLMVRRLVMVGKGGRKTVSAEAYVGYTGEQFRAHIEGQFVEGMTWANHGEWHVDHIHPVSAYLKAGVDDPKIINALSNLRPIWAVENLRKGDRVMGELACDIK